MQARSFYIETYGCEMNKSDSIDIALSLEREGLFSVDNPSDADLVILNTCAVRDNAEQRISGRLGFYRSLKKRNRRKLTLVVTGCMSQEWGKRLVDRYPEVDIVTGTYRFLEIPYYVREFERIGHKIIDVSKGNYRFSPFRGERAQDFSAWVNIIKGCSNFCSYCIVPYLRGPEKSRPSSEILEEVRALADRGVVEVTLLGQNVNAYGRDSGDISFGKLLEKLSEIQGIHWIRFLTSHPKDFTPILVRQIASLDKVCKHFHLPLQSGSNKILSLMKRGYTITQYLELIETVRKYIKESAITTDIIVGFPHETDEDFTKTIDIVSDVRFDDAFMYRYSDRPHTQAARMKNKVPQRVIKARLSYLIEIQRGISLEIKMKEVGKKKKVLIEKRSKKNPQEFLCRTETNKMVVVPTKQQAGNFIDVLIESISGNTLRGTEVVLQPVR